MRKFSFTNGKFYHIYNRGIEKRKIFLEDGDYLRFIHYLYELNDKDGLSCNFRRQFNYARGQASRSLSKKKRNLLVDIICFCLMPNHFHLLLRQLVENGISQFMQKLGTAWTMFFNAKYERTGRLFQGTFKAIEVGRENQFLHLSRYQHLNPLDLIQPDWRERGIKQWGRVNQFLKNYRWSSYLDYIGKKNFPSVINPESLKEYFKNGREYKKFVHEWIIKDLDKINDILLET